MTRSGFILKQEFSAARTVHVTFEIDWHSQIIKAELRSSGGEDLLNVDALVVLVKGVLPERYGITAFAAQLEESRHPVESEWRVRLHFAGLNLPVRFIRELSGHITVEVMSPTR